MVPETAVERISDRVGRMVEDGVQAWVGTRHGTVEQPLWQVKLRSNEEVEILGETSWPNPEGYSTIWYQISPPPGEFRWIKISDLRLPKNLDDLPDIKSGRRGPPSVKSADLITSTITDRNLGAPPIQTSSFQDASSEPFLNDPEFEEWDQEVTLNPPSQNEETVNRGWRQARRQIRVADNRYDYESAEPFKTPALNSRAIGSNRISSDQAKNNRISSFDSLDSGNTQNKDIDIKVNESNAVSDVTNNTGNFVPVAPISGPVSQRIRKLESSLTLEMQKPPAEWDFDSLLRQSTSIASTTNDVREREQAKRLQQKIRNCVSIKSRYSAAFSNNANNNNGVNAQPVSTTAPTTTNSALSATYDAHGWLNQLVNNNDRLTPNYVLEDDNGKVVYHIAPSPGLNLQRYMKQRVGIMGRRGYHRDLGLNHVTAERVVLLNKRR